METPSVRILVVGDSGVGKTTFLRTLCEEKLYDSNSIQSHRWTIGCDIHIMLYKYREKEMFIEFIDVGGHPKYAISRSIYYNEIQGIIFMHDLSNTKSYEHLKEWMLEIHSVQNTKGCVFSNTTYTNTHSHPSIFNLPMFCIGTKKDLVPNVGKFGISLPEFQNIDAIDTCIEPYINLDYSKVHNYLDRVIQISTTQVHNEINSNYNSSISLRQTKTKSEWW